MLHLSVFPVGKWCASMRYWANGKLPEGRTKQVCMCRRALNLWPRVGEEIQDYFKRTACWCQTVMERVGTLVGGAGPATLPGLRTETTRSLPAVVAWRDAA